MKIISKDMNPISSFINLFLNISIKKGDLSKYVDEVRLALNIAKIIDDKKMSKLLEKELKGYNGFDNVPHYRVIKNTQIRSSITELVRIIIKNENDLNASVRINGKMFRLRDINLILLMGFETYTINYIGSLIAELTKEAPLEDVMPGIDLSKLPENLKEMFGG